MTNDKDFIRELPKQNGIEPERISERDRKRVYGMLAKEKRRVSQSKRVTLILWLLIGISLLGLGLIAYITRPDFPVAAFVAGTMVIYVLIPYAVICSIRLYVSSRSASLHEIQATLADIEQQLRQLSRKE
jgi:uncharacterized membrane protein YqjE